MQPTHAGFCDGIGGFHLVAEAVGFKNIFSVEKETWCNRILKKNFKNLIQYEDIYDFDGKPYRGAIDVLSAGFPCQPFSWAGLRKGAKDSRFLWPEVLRGIDQIRPFCFVGENVAGLQSMENCTPFEKWVFLGMESKTYSKRKYCRFVYRKRQSYVLNEIIEDIEKIGYTVETFNIPAASKAAWHIRQRIWVFAYSNDSKSKRLKQHSREVLFEKEAKRLGMGSVFSTNTDNSLYKRELDFRKTSTETKGGQNQNTPERKTFNRKRVRAKSGSSVKVFAYTDNASQQKQRIGFATSKKFAPVRRDSWWSVEPRVGRMANGVPNRVDRLRGLGNAIVPVTIYEPMKEIYKLLTKTNEYVN